jgi:hypothetical protein
MEFHVVKSNTVYWISNVTLEQDNFILQTLPDQIYIYDGLTGSIEW